MLRRRRTSLVLSPQGSGDENAGALTRFLPGKSHYVTHHITTHHITTRDLAYRWTSDQAQARPGGQDKGVHQF